VLLGRRQVVSAAALPDPAESFPDELIVCARAIRTGCFYRFDPVPGFFSLGAARLSFSKSGQPCGDRLARTRTVVGKPAINDQCRRRGTNFWG
jgi:hypothetical protein